MVCADGISLRGTNNRPSLTGGGLSSRLPGMRRRDSVELEYERAIQAASADPDRAYELSIGLRQYRELYRETHAHRCVLACGHAGDCA